MDYVLLDVIDVKTSYKKFSVENINFNLKSGDIFGLVGRSGSGKSTLIKTIIGKKKPDKGEIKAYINNKAFPIRKTIGYSPQENSLYPFLTLEENIMTFGRLWKLKKDVIKKRMDYLLRRLDLANSKKKRINQLSEGMQKRADLAVTLIHNPDILILDEPFAGLDISIQKFIWILLKELSKQGKIIIVSSHILKDIQKYCNIFGLISRGYFYNHQQIGVSLKKRKQKLETYLEQLFTYDLLSEGVGKK